MNEYKPVHLDKQTTDGALRNLDTLYQLFPSCFTEAKDVVTGEMRKAVDWAKLRALLGDYVEDGEPEKYDFTWVGRRAAQREAAAPCRKTLRPCPSPNESVDWDTTQNLYIEGDNLEVLKLLQNSYMGKVKMIYIDPPYNTGSDSFVYPDDYSQSAKEYDEHNKDDEGKRFRINTDSNGRFHSDWCSMIYMRLMVARNLLAEDGAIFISIDDNESFNLKKICDEVFGEDNFINCISVKMSELSGVKMKHLNKYAKLKETLYIYSRNKFLTRYIIEKKRKDTETLKSYLRYYSQIITNIKDPCEKWRIVPLNSYLQDNGITIESDEDLIAWKLNNSDRMVYRTNSRTVISYIRDNPNAPAICEFTNEDGNRVVKWDNKEMLFLEKYIEESLGDIWLDISTINLNKETESLVFENGQKPLSLMHRVIKALDTKNEIVLDFFSGSATTAHAVMQLNAEDGGNRKFIMVQLPEETAKDSEAYKAGYKNICEIGKERIRRAGKKIKEEHPEAKDIDIGFRVLKCDESNFKPVAFGPSSYKQEQLDMFLDNIKEDRTGLDLLFDCMMRWGLELSLPYTTQKADGCTIYNVDDGNLVACFDGKVTESTIDAIAQMHPLRVVFRDSSFNEAAEKMNLFELFKQKCGWTDQEVQKNVRVI